MVSNAGGRPEELAQMSQYPPRDRGGAFGECVENGALLLSLFQQKVKTLNKTRDVSILNRRIIFKDFRTDVSIYGRHIIFKDCRTDVSITNKRIIYKDCRTDVSNNSRPIILK